MRAQNLRKALRVFSLSRRDHRKKLLDFGQLFTLTWVQRLESEGVEFRIVNMYKTHGLCTSVKIEMDNMS